MSVKPELDAIKVKLERLAEYGLISASAYGIKDNGEQIGIVFFPSHINNFVGKPLGKLGNELRKRCDQSRMVDGDVFLYSPEEMKEILDAAFGCGGGII